MSEKIPIPVPVIEQQIFQNDVDICDENETQRRLFECKNCEHFVVNNKTICGKTGCSISLMSTFKFKECPINRW